jgi:hypothetical protein
MAEGPVRDTRAMIAGMRPVLMPGTYVFCAAPPGMSEVPPEALASFREERGCRFCFPSTPPPRSNCPRSRRCVGSPFR